ncbi:unnamed protein product [Ascophyllum nodosum]
MDSGGSGFRVNHDFSFADLQEILDEFLRTKKGNEMIGELCSGLESRRKELLCPDPLRCYPKTAEDRSALQSGNVVIKGLRTNLPPEVVPALLVLSDELNLNEISCVEIWSQVEETWQRRALEKKLAEPAGSLSNDLPLAARKFFYLERQSLLMFLSGLFKAALMPDLSAAKRMVVDREIFCLLEQGLAPNLMSFVAELLGPEGLRRASPTMTASGQVGTAPSFGVFGAPANPAQVGVAAAGGAGAGGDGSGSEMSKGACARREDFMLDSLLSSVEVLFFIYYSYQIKPEEAKQLVTLLETAGRELLALQEAVGQNVAVPGGSNLQNNFTGITLTSLGGRLGTATAAVTTTAERQREVVRLCAVMEATSALLCTLSMAFSLDFALYGRNAPGKKNDSGNALAAIATEGSGGEPFGGDGNGDLFGGNGSGGDIAPLDDLICNRKWDHVQVQGVVLAIWSTFMAPSAAAKLAFGTKAHADAHLRKVVISANTNGAVKFLRGPVLATLRRPPFPTRDLTPRPFYLEALSSLTGAYVGIMLDKFLDCSLPPRVEQQVEDLEAHWYDAGSLGFDQQQHHQQATQGQRMLEAIEKEDTLEDLMYWTGQLAEAHPEFAEKKLWEGEDQALARYLSEKITEHRDLLAPMLSFLAGAALKTHEQVNELMETADCGWDFFIGNIERCASDMMKALQDSQQPNQPVAGRAVYASPAPHVKISERTYNVLEPLCVLLQRMMLHEEVRRKPLVPDQSPFRVMIALMNLLRTGVRPSMKGAIFKALAACAKERGYAPRIWNFIEEAQARLVSTGVGEQGQPGAGKAAVDIYGGLFVELELAESREGTYPETEGFCCLIQELVQHDLPYGLGETHRYSGAGGIQPYVAYLLNCVLMTDLRFADPGERWRIVARVFQVVLTLLQRYPLTGNGASRLGSASMTTPEDVDACRLDFEPSALKKVLQRRCKSPGYYILREILGQGGLFRQLVQVLRGQDGVGGLKAVRTGTATAAVLKHLLPKTAGSAPTADRFAFKAFTSPPSTAERPRPFGLDPVEPGEPGPDWSWWRERSYDGNMAIPFLSASVLLSCSRNLPVGAMMSTLLASDPRECDALAKAYTACLAADGIIAGKNLSSLEKMLCPPNGEADADFMTLDAALMGAGTSRREWEGEDGALRIVRLCILDLLLENVEYRGPNLAHLLLGLTSSSTPSVHHLAGGANSPMACLEAVVGLLLSPGNIQEEPRVAEKCAHLLYKLCSSKDTRVAVLDRLRNASRVHRSHEAFFPQMLRVILGKSGRSTLEEDDEAALSFERHSLAWLLKSAAIDIRTACEGSPVYVFHAKALLEALFVAESPVGGAPSAGPIIPHFGALVPVSAASDSLDQAPAPLLTLLDSKIDLGDSEPVRNMRDMAVRGLLVQAATPLPSPGGCAEAGGQDFRIIDLGYLQELIEVAVARGDQGKGGSLSADVEERMRAALTWAIQWNQHTVDLASQSHLCQAWRQVMEVAFVSACVLLFGPAQEPSKGVAPRRLLPALLLGTLRKLAERGDAGEKLLEPLARACMSVAGVMRDLGSWAPLQLAESKELISCLISCLVGTQDREASSVPPGEGSKTYRAFMYGCLVLLLDHTQEEVRGGLELMGTGDAWSRPNNAASNDEHRMQNREILVEQIHPLAVLLVKDAVQSPDMTQILGLSLLSSIIATLGAGPSRDPSRWSLCAPTAGGTGSGRESSDDKHSRELQGNRTRADLLGFLHDNAFFSNLAKLLGGVRPDSDTALLGIVVASVIGFLTQVACSAKGAELLLDAGVVEGLTKSVGMMKGTKAVLNASALGPLGANSAVPVFESQGKLSLRDLVIPGLLLLQGMLGSTPENVLLAEQASALLARHDQLVHHLLLFKDCSLDALDAMSAVLGILAHVSKQPFQGILERHVKLATSLMWRGLAERALVGFGVNPLPQGSVTTAGGGWWPTLQPMTEWEKHLASKRCQPPPGGALEWNMFDEAKLEASQRALSHCVDFLRCCAAAESNRTLVAGSGLETSARRPWLSEKPEELCVALRACVDIVRGGGGARRGPRFGKDREGESDRYGQLPFFAIFFRLRAEADDRFVRGLQYVIEGLLAVLLHLVNTGSEEGRSQLSAYGKGLVPTLTELLQDTSSDPFVLLAARALIERVSVRDEVMSSNMNVA